MGKHRLAVGKDWKKIIGALVIIICSIILTSAAYASDATKALKPMKVVKEDTTSETGKVNGSKYIIKNKIGQYRLNYCGKTNWYHNDSMPSGTA